MICPGPTSFRKTARSYAWNVPSLKSDGFECNDSWNWKGSQPLHARGCVGGAQVDNAVKVETRDLRPHQRFAQPGRVDSGECISQWYTTALTVLYYYPLRNLVRMTASADMI